MRLQIAIPESHVTHQVLDAGLEAVTRLDESLIKSGAAPTFTQGLEAGIRWRPEPPGAERFDHAKTVMGRGWGDCDDLAPWRAAELRVSGSDRGARAVVFRSGPQRWHAVVKKSDGTYEDPSREAGMASVGGGVGAVNVACGPAAVPMMMRGAPSAKVALTRHGSNWYSRCDLPIVGTPWALASTANHRDARGAVTEAILGGCAIGSCGMVSIAELAKLYALQGAVRGVPSSVIGDALRGMGCPTPGAVTERAYKVARELAARGRFNVTTPRTGDGYQVRRYPQGVQSQRWGN